VILQTLGAILARIFREFAQIFRDFVNIFTDFAQIFRNFARIFDKSKLWGALAPSPPTPLDLPISSNLLFNFSKQASTVVASKFHKNYPTFHLFRFLFRDAILTTRVSRGLLHLNKIVTSVILQMA